MAKELQVLIGDKWEYVFCHNAMRRQENPVTTQDKKLSLKDDALEYFTSKYANHKFRISNRSNEHGKM